jgi:hypothetical protein
MKNRSWCWVLLAASAPAVLAGTMVLESAPNLPIPDDSCLDPALGHGEGGVVDVIPLPGWVAPIFGLRVEVEVDHGWRSDLQMAVSAGPANSSAPVPMPLGAAASATPRLLANGHDSWGDNYYATFTDLATRDCFAQTACGSQSLCVAAGDEIECRPDEPIFNLVTASATPQVVRLHLCDREVIIAGTLRRWRIFVTQFVPVELQSFSVD